MKDEPTELPDEWHNRQRAQANVLVLSSLSALGERWLTELAAIVAITAIKAI